jgi:TPR repeat protein
MQNEHVIFGQSFRSRSELRFFLPVICFVGLALSFSCISRAQEPSVTECDKYAASDLDLQRVSEPVLFNEIKPELAVPACKAALSEWPNSSRLTYQLARSLLANKQWLQGLRSLRKAAEAGYPAAQLALGIQYRTGSFGLFKDGHEAQYWIGKAADQNNRKAQNLLGTMYAQAHENTRAFAWYCRAAEQGDADAQTNLGNAYYEGTAWIGAPADTARAIEWLRKAAEQGHKTAQQKLKMLSQQSIRQTKGADKCREVIDCLKSGRDCR